MSGNVVPQFTKNGNVSSVLVTAANTSSAGGGTIGTDIFLAFTANATNGSWLEYVRCIPVATAATATTATVMRIFLSTQTAGAVTSANTWLLQEITLPAVNADNASAAALFFDVFFGMRLPAGYSILVTNHAAPAANTNWRAVAVGGDY